MRQIPSIHLINRLGEVSGGFASSDVDSAAKAIVAAITNTGTTVTNTQLNAINTFIKTGKSQGWYTLLTRFFLPIWDNPTPNAIDWITLNSGSFVGNVVHEIGYVQADGTTTAFNTGTSPAGAGMLQDSSTVGTLMRSTTNILSPMGGVQDSSNNTRISIGTFGTGSAGGRLNSALGASQATSDIRGINIYTRNNATNVNYYIRTTSGFTTLINNASLTSVGIASVQNMHFMATNNNGSLDSFANNGRQFGMFFMALGMSAAAANNFSLAVKNLWETCSGLTLP